MPTIVPSTRQIEPRIRAAVANAAHLTGTDFKFLYNQARVESGLDPAAKARTSSAAGLYQFTGQTWRNVVKTHGEQFGAGWAAHAITRSGSKLEIADPDMAQAVDRLRYDPEFSSVMAGAFAADNRVQLEGGLGRDVEPVDLYLAHFLGSAGARQFLAAHDADPRGAAAPLFPAAARANRDVFYASDGQARSLDAIRSHFAARLADGPPPPLPFQAARSIQSQRLVTRTEGRSSVEMQGIEPLPASISLDVAKRAYRRLSALGA